MRLVSKNFFRFHTFLSYRSKDSEAVIRLSNLMQELGLRIWLDSDTGEHDQAPRSSSDSRGRPLPGDENEILSVLKEAIKFSIFVTVVTSSYTMKSIWVRREIKVARQLNKPLFFWHLTGYDEENRVSMRYHGDPLPNTTGPDELFETLAPHYRHEFLASSASNDFMRSLALEDGVNILGIELAPFRMLARRV